MVGITAGVQDLQRDLAARRVHGLRHHLMPPRRARSRQGAREGLGPARDIGRETARHHQADATLGAFAEVGGQLAQVASVLQAGVHGTHEHAVADLGETEVQRREQMGIVGV